jgi:hypothetical protein
MDFTGKPLKGMVYVGPGGTRDAATLGRWLKLAIEHAESLPEKRRCSPPAPYGPCGTA